jgi:HEPN domain-containing protein
MEQAERDMERARLDLQHGYFEWACFVCQQSAEKAVKAAHLAERQSVRGHGILGLLEALLKNENASEAERLRHAARVLDRYYITARYPNGFPFGKPADYFDSELAMEAISAAENILRFCRSRLSGQGKAP